MMNYLLLENTGIRIRDATPDQNPIPPSASSK